MTKPSPMELIRFCRDAGIDLFDNEVRSRLALIQTEKDRFKAADDYSKLVRNLLKRGGKADSLTDKLRRGLQLWIDVGKIAADVIAEARTPREFAGNARMNFRWHLSSKIHVPQRVRDDAELQWEIACVQGKQMSVANALDATRFKTPKGIHGALRDFGCPSRLTNRLTSSAVEQLRWLDKKWRRTQNKKRSAKRRRKTSQEKKST